MNQHFDNVSAASELDAATLAELQTLMAEDLAELVAAYIEDGQAHVAAISAGLDADNAEQVVTAAHSLKSSSANISALGIAELARQIEATAKTGDRQATKELAQTLPERFAQAVTELRPWLDAPTGHNVGRAD